MIIFMYRWHIPPHQQGEFQKNWKELTETSKATHGLISAILYRCGEYHVSIANWSSKRGWEHWKRNHADHPYHLRWRAFQVADEILVPVAHVDTTTREA